MKPLLFAVMLLATPAFAAGMSVDEAWNVYQWENDWPVCEQGNEYEGGPKLSDEEIKEACARYEAAVDILLQAGLIKE